MECVSVSLRGFLVRACASVPCDQEKEGSTSSGVLVVPLATLKLTLSFGEAQMEAKLFPALD